MYIAYKQVHRINHIHTQLNTHHRASAVSSRPFLKAGGLALVDGCLALDGVLMLQNLSLLLMAGRGVVEESACSGVFRSPAGVFLWVHGGRKRRKTYRAKTETFVLCISPDICLPTASAN